MTHKKRKSLARLQQAAAMRTQPAVRTQATARATPTATPVPATNEAPMPTAEPSASLPNLQAAAQVPSPALVRDPVNGPFLGGAPQPLPDVPVTAVFLLLFILGALLHFHIRRANKKRGHLFFLSNLLFDFCLVRTITCVFRIVWAFQSPREVILIAVISQNAGAVVLFNINLFFTQRIIRAMHPFFGWHPAFGYASYFLILSIPTVALLDAISTIVSFYSAGIDSRLDATEKALKFGAIWTLMLCLLPLVVLYAASAVPSAEAEKFGTGQLRNKVALLILSAVTLGVGAAIRLAALFNPTAGIENSPLFSREVFYTTGLTLELVTVASYAYFRIDLLFYVPNGARGPGDYESGSRENPTTDKVSMEIEHAMPGSDDERRRLSDESQHALIYAALYSESRRPEAVAKVPKAYRGRRFGRSS